ncbi:hypothetical protein [Pseudomonas sp. LS-2]|uniref:hypothetical protein n=1 Tax=Pseudomonas sp. LS-2 TaxID=2315859 RepID=UPI000E747D80|nr:hypothetical protein [Pseudomonas sp. LS-2]RJX80322.1 hypothetical protein D3M70_12295 [Pseudomonas sp. LS-2]
MHPAPLDVTPDEHGIDAEERANQWLADGIKASEDGRVTKAERCFQKAKFWRGRADQISGRAGSQAAACIE